MGFRMTMQTLAVLRVLLDHPLQQHYGLEISKAAGLPSGSLYPILARLEQQGWLTSDWEQVDQHEAGRPRRRYYELTHEGAAGAQQALTATVEQLSPRSGTRGRRMPRPGWGVGRGAVTAVIVFVVTLILVPMLLAEFTDWLPWVASRLVLRAANHLPVERRGRYTEERSAELNALPGGKLTKLAFGLRLYARARTTAQVLREELEAEQKQPRTIAADSPDLMDTAARVLSLAMQTADQAIADGRREADDTSGVTLTAHEPHTSKPSIQETPDTFPEP